MSEALPRHLEVLRENFNADIRAAQRDGITCEELIATAGALAEDLLMALPQDLRAFGVATVVVAIADGVSQRTAEEAR